MMKITLFRYLKHAILINIFLFGISNAMEFPEGSIWHKAGLTIAQKINDQFSIINEKGSGCVNIFKTHIMPQRLFHKISIDNDQSITLITSDNINKSFNPTIVKSRFGKKIGYFIDCTNIHEDSNEDEIEEKEDLKQKKEKNKASSIPRKKSNALGFLLEGVREELARSKVENNRLSNQYNGLQIAWDKAEKELAACRANNKELHNENTQLKNKPLEIDRSVKTFNKKNRWFFERHPKTSLFFGCAASLSLGLFWPSIKAKIF
jgi:hypothetical protein